MKPKLHIIVGSTRPGRVGPRIADWVLQQAVANDKFDAEVVDIDSFNLPLYDEPHHPATGRYENDHTKAWSQSVSAADAFIFVTPEYNGAPTPALVNALDYLLREWAYKPAAFVSYGGVSAGLRAVQPTKLMLNNLGMVPIREAVAIPFFFNSLDADGAFVASDLQTKAAADALDELYRWTEALRPLRKA
jgi:NAD(P)H-dependent FMN reductase